jgi:hypothetical protein
MNKRIANKRAERWTCRVLTLPLTLDHARPSFWKLKDVGHQRACLVEKMGELGVKRSVRHFVANHWSPEMRHV